MRLAIPTALSIAAFVLLAVGTIALVLLPEGLVRRLDWHVHLCWMQGFHEGISHGAWYPRWLDGANEGQGAPVFVYYAPVAYFLGSALQAIGLSVAGALKGVYLLSLLLCGAGMVAWLRPVCGWGRAIALGSFCVLAPQLGSFALLFNMPASALAVGVLPWLGAALERRGGSRAMTVACVAAATALVLLSHLLTGFQTLVLLACYGLLALVLSRGRRYALGVLLPAAVLALLLAAVYLVPLITGADAIHREHLVQQPMWRIADNLLYAWVVGGPPSSGLTAEAEWTNAVLLLALAAAIWRLRRARGAGHASRWIPWAGAALAAWLLMTVLAAPLYVLVEPLQYLQFGWRWQALFALCTLRVVASALAPSAAGEGWAGGTGPRRLHGALSLALLAACGAALAASTGATVLRLQAMLPGHAHAQRVPASEARLRAQSCAWPMLEYRPTAMGDAWQRDLGRLPRTVTVLQGRAHVMSVRHESHARHYDIVADTDARLLFPILAYPGWTTLHEGTRLPAMAFPDDGRINMSLQRGRHEVALEFTPLGSRSGAWISLCALGLWVGLVGMQRVRSRGSRTSRAAALARPDGGQGQIPRAFAGMPEIGCLPRPG